MDSWTILGIEAGANDEEIRAAYLAKVKQYPPESKPEQFEEVRDAYQILRDPRSRAKRVLYGPDPVWPLPQLFDEIPQPGHHAGPEAWMAVIEERSKT